jgi:Glycosyl hydrolases family 39
MALSRAKSQISGLESVERYGVSEAREWFFEVWNEPNLKASWTGTLADYFKLYRHTSTPLRASTERFKSAAPCVLRPEPARRECFAGSSASATT